MFNRMETLPVRYFDTHAHGDIMSNYTNDTDAIRQMIGQSLPMLIQSSLSILSMFVMMLYYSIWLTITVWIFIGIMVTITKKFGSASAYFMMEQQKSLAREEGFMEEMMEGYMLNGKINPVSGIFLMKNNFGYTDKSEVVLTPNNPFGENTASPEELQQKYLTDTAGDFGDCLEEE